MNSKNSRTAVVAMALGLVAAATIPASASGGGGADVRRSGGCSHSATWKLKAKPDNGRLEVEGEVDSNRVGQTWRWRILHDGRTSAHGVGKTARPSGSFSVERLLVDTRGADHVGWRAYNRATGERCRGGLTI